MCCRRTSAAPISSRDRAHMAYRSCLEAALRCRCPAAQTTGRPPPRRRWRGRKRLNDECIDVVHQRDAGYGGLAGGGDHDGIRHADSHQQKWLNDQGMMSRSSASREKSRLLRAGACSGILPPPLHEFYIALPFYSCEAEIQAPNCTKNGGRAEKNRPASGRGLSNGPGSGTPPHWPGRPASPSSAAHQPPRSAPPPTPLTMVYLPGP